MNLRSVPAMIAAGVIGILVVGGLLVWRAESKVNKVALTEGPKPVTVVTGEATTFRPSRMYVGTLEPWVGANIGPQFISAYVDTVLVRPGAIVKRGAVLATLDCRNASAASRAVAMQARAIEEREKAISNESARLQQLKAGNFVSENEAEQKAAQSAAEQAELAATQANLAKTALEVSDCILRAPFDGEVATRTADPGAFVRPGNFIVSVVDRSVVRFTADAPEIDFGVVGRDTAVVLHALAVNKDFPGKISRRAPSADMSTRTVHFEVDLPDPDRVLPVGTTAECNIEVGEPIEATKIPIFAASVRNGKATIFVVDKNVARQKTLPVLGERGGDLFVGTELRGALVVSEGRSLLADGDKVASKPVAAVKDRVEAPSGKTTVETVSKQ